MIEALSNIYTEEFNFSKPSKSALITLVKPTIRMADKVMRFLTKPENYDILFYLSWYPPIVDLLHSKGIFDGFNSVDEFLEQVNVEELSASVESSPEPHNSTNPEQHKVNMLILMIHNLMIPRIKRETEYWSIADDDVPASAASASAVEQEDQEDESTKAEKGGKKKTKRKRKSKKMKKTTKSKKRKYYKTKQITRRSNSNIKL
jgi:hypothetical protein